MPGVGLLFRSGLSSRLAKSRLNAGRVGEPTPPLPQIVGAGGDPRHGNGRGPDLVLGGAGGDTLNGEEGRDVIAGNAGADIIDGGPGCDRIFAGPDDDKLEGGPGATVARRWWGGRHGWRCERLHGGAGNDVSNGGPGRDFMSGGKDDDTQSGGAGADKIFANRGRDHSDGGDGPDVLWALSRFDVTAIGDAEGDELSGGNGRDLFRVRDGEVDLVHCGADRDHVLADQFDVVDNDCEHVDRRDVTSLD